MSSLTLIVLGQAYFIGTSPNIPPTAPCRPNSISDTVGSGLIEPAPDHLVKREDYTYMPGVGAYKVHNVAANWTHAKLACEEEGGHLAIVNSIAESKHIVELFESSRPKQTGSFHSFYAIIGFRERSDGNGYITVLGGPLENTGYHEWAATEPNNLGGKEHCGSIDVSGGLNDVDCENKYSFICELPDAIVDHSPK